MKKIIVLAILLAIVTTGIVCSNENAPYINTPDKEAVIKGNNEFALNLYAKLREQEGNLFFSPWSISTALAMTYGGARGETEAQMAKVLHFDLPQKQLHPAFAQMINDLTAQKRGYQLHIANALWGQKGYNFLKTFLDLTQKNYGAGLHEVDFIKEIEATCKTINDWVDKQTRGRIKKLVKPDSIDPGLTRLILTNAIYFKGDWAYKFKKEGTKDIPFTLLTGHKIDVPMMNQQRKFKYMRGNGFQAVEMPYVGDELSMVVLLPRKTNGITDFEKSFTIENITQWLEKLKPHKVGVIVCLPKFRITLELYLNQMLSSMGMPDAFINGKADFSGMTDQERLFINKVVHKAFVDVNEEGTEAVAVTGVWGEANGDHPELFRADHPFIFLIRDMRSGSILFMGRVMNPKE